MKSILVVCIGNICRSPMAEYFFKEKNPTLACFSAGISGLAGHPADKRAIHSMDALGINMQSHVAQKLSQEHLLQADLVLVMDNQQKEFIEQQYPFSKGKVFRLGHWQDQNIADPYGENQAFFDETCHLIQQCVDDWYLKINS